MNANQKIFVGCIAALILCLAVVGKHFFPDLDTGVIIGLASATLSGLGVTHLNGDAPTAGGTVAAPGSAQGGFASVRLLIVLAAIALGFSLAGCTTTTASLYSGVYTQAKAGVQVFDDNTLTTMKDLVCAQPYSAIQRHPELQAGIVTLCGPMANTASIDPAQVMQMLAIAKQLGLVPGAPATAASAPK